MTPLKACQICDAPARTLKPMAGGAWLCGRCGFFFRVNDQGELVEWATTNTSHPRRAAVGLVIAALLGFSGIACIGRAVAAPQTAPARPLPTMIVLEDWLPPTVRVCVPQRPIATADYPYACMTLMDLRVQLRTRRMVHDPHAAAPPE